MQGSVIGTLGNFSASIGKAKSKKTFNVSAIVAAALKNGTVLNYTAELPENKRKILYVDTEQSTYHCEIVARRSLRMAGLPTDSNHENLEFLVLRKYTPEERIAIVREAIYRTENVGLVVIDGIRDMVYDINSSQRVHEGNLPADDMDGGKEYPHSHHTASEQGGRACKGAHRNRAQQQGGNGAASRKGREEPRCKHSQNRTYQGSGLRAICFPHQRGGIARTAGGLPVQGQGSRQKGIEGSSTPYRDITEQQHRIALEAAFTLKDEYGYKELEGALREAYASVGVRLSDHRLRDLITVLKNKRMIVQENGRKYTFKPDFHY